MGKESSKEAPFQTEHGLGDKPFCFSNKTETQMLEHGESSKSVTDRGQD